MNWGKNKNSNNVNHSLDTLKPQFAGLNEIGKKIVYILQVSSPKIIDIDELCQKTQLSLMEVSPMLLQLEIGNIVESYPGNKYKLRSSM